MLEFTEKEKEEGEGGGWKKEGKRERKRYRETQKIAKTRQGRQDGGG